MKKALKDKSKRPCKKQKATWVSTSVPEKQLARLLDAVSWRAVWLKCYSQEQIASRNNMLASSLGSAAEMVCPGRVVRELDKKIWQHGFASAWVWGSSRPCDLRNLENHILFCHLEVQNRVVEKQKIALFQHCLFHLYMPYIWVFKKSPRKNHHWLRGEEQHSYPKSIASLT